MKEQFVTYEIALALKELGFDEKCLASYYTDDERNYDKGDIYDCRRKLSSSIDFDPFKEEFDNFYINSNETYYVSAPLWQQAFNWIFKQLDFYYPFIRLEIYSDASGGWYAPPDDDSNEYWNTSFSSLEEAINQVLDLILKSK